MAPARTGSVPANAPLRSVQRTAQPTAGKELWAGLHLSESDPAGHELEQLAIRAHRFTPRVSVAPPDGLLLEVAGSLHLFGEVEGLRREITGECLHLQLRPVLAVVEQHHRALAAGFPICAQQRAQPPHQHIRRRHRI